MHPRRLVRLNELILQTRARRPITSVVVTHDLKTVFKVADRVVMFCPLGRLGPDDPQILFDGTPDELRSSRDPRSCGCARSTRSWPARSRARCSRCSWWPTPATG